VANGWVTADAGLTYTTNGTYGGATLDTTTATISYFLDDTLPATNALAQDQVVADAFAIQVIDATGLTAQASATFDITGTADLPTVTVSPASNPIIEAGAIVAGEQTVFTLFTVAFARSRW
jgi:VCBS repeat-containing protein